MFDDFVCAEAADLAMHGGAVYVGVDIQPFSNGAVHRRRCRNIPDFRAARNRNDCDRRAHQPIRAADAGGEAGVYAGFDHNISEKTGLLMKISNLCVILIGEVRC